MNGLITKKRLWLLVPCVLCVLCVFCVSCLSDSAEQIIIEKEIFVGNQVNDEFEDTYLDGPMPISLASPTENDISMEQALQIAQEAVLQDGTVLKETLDLCLRNVNFVILSNIKGSYHIGGWIVNYFLDNSYADVHTVIMEGSSGRVLLSVRGGSSAIGGWHSADNKHYTGLGGLNFLLTVEVAAVFDTVFGFPGDTLFRRVLPTENDISQADALEIAKVYVRKRLRIPEEEVDSYFVHYMFVQERTADTVWIVCFYSTEVDEWGRWTPICDVSVSSVDGTVVGVAMP